VIFVAENSNKFQKIRFWKEKSVEDQFIFWAKFRQNEKKKIRKKFCRRFFEL